MQRRYAASITIDQPSEGFSSTSYAQGLMSCRVMRWRRGELKSMTASVFAAGTNYVGLYDFVQKRTQDSRALRIVVVLDEVTRRCLANVIVTCAMSAYSAKQPYFSDRFVSIAGMLRSRQSGCLRFGALGRHVPSAVATR